MNDERRKRLEEKLEDISEQWREAGVMSVPSINWLMTELEREMERSKGLLEVLEKYRRRCMRAPSDGIKPIETAEFLRKLLDAYQESLKEEK